MLKKLRSGIKGLVKSLFSERPNRMWTTISTFSLGSQTELKLETDGLDYYLQDDLIQSLLSIKASTLADSDIKAYDETGEQIDECKLYDLIENNPYHTKFELMELTVLHKEVFGNAFWRKRKNDSGVLLGIEILYPKTVSLIVERDPNKPPVAGYLLTLKGRDPLKLRPDEVVHFRYPNIQDPFWGESPLAVLDSKTKIDLYVQSHMEFILKNKGTPGLVIKTKKNIDPDNITRLKADIDEEYTGDGVGKTLILTGDMEVENLSFDMEQIGADKAIKLVETRIQARLRVPGEYVGTYSGAEFSTYSNKEEARKGFHLDTIKPLQRRISEVIEKDKDLNPEGYNIEFDDSATQAVQSMTRDYKFFVLEAYKAGAITNAELRSELGYPGMIDADPFPFKQPQTPNNPGERDDERANYPKI